MCPFNKLCMTLTVGAIVDLNTNQTLRLLLASKLATQYPDDSVKYSFAK